MRVFLDTNVLIDVLMLRAGCESSCLVLSSEHHDFCVSVLTMANIAYIMRHALKGEKLYDCLVSLNEILRVVSITEEQYEQALRLRASDFEDALQYYCALSCHSEVIVSRNVKDLTFSALPVLTPEEFLTANL